MAPIRANKRLIFDRYLPYLLIAPATTLVTGIIFYSLLRGIYISFTKYQLAESATPVWIGAANYVRLFRDPIAWRALKNTVIWTVCVVGLEFAIGFGMALLLNQQFRGRRIFRALVLLPWAMPSVAAAMVWRWMYAEQYGVVNYLLGGIGLGSSSISWLGDPAIALFSIIIVGIWRGVPFMTIMLLAGLQGIPSDLYEAAKIDGAGASQSFRYITIPQMKGAIITTTLLATIWTFNSFDLPWVMTKGGPAYSSHLISTYVYQTSFSFFDLGYATSLGSIMMAILFVFALLYVRQATREE